MPIVIRYRIVLCLSAGRQPNRDKYAGKEDMGCKWEETDLAGIIKAEDEYFGLFAGE